MKSKNSNFLSLFKTEPIVPQKRIIENDSNLKTGYEFLRFMCKNVRNRSTAFNSQIEPLTDRATFIVSQLNNMNVQYQVIPFTFSDINMVGYGKEKMANVHVRFPATNPNTKKTIIFTAHHDIANSNSENCQDNTASVCNLLHLCSEVSKMKRRKRNIHVVFTDCEEMGGRGAEKLCSMLSANKFGDINIEGIISLELTAVGDKLWVDKAGWGTATENSKLSKKIESLWDLEFNRFSTPFNESMVIRRNGFDSWCIGILPEEDTENLKNNKWSDNWRLCHSRTDVFENANEEDMTRLVMFMKRFVND